MTTKTYNVGAYPFSISCKASCQFAGKDESKRFRKTNQATFVAGGGDVSAMRATCKANANGGRFIDWTGPLVPGLYHCQRCGTAHNVGDVSAWVAYQAQANKQAKTQPAKAKAVQVETAPQTGQAFDAMEFAWDNINMENGKFPSGFSTKLASRIADAIGCSFANARPRATKVCNAVKREWKIDGPSGFLPAGGDTTAQTLKFIQRISGKPQIKPAPKAQTKPVPTTDGSIVVIDATEFDRLVSLLGLSVQTVRTATVNGKVIQCS